MFARKPHAPDHHVLHAAEEPVEWEAERVGLAVSKSAAVLVVTLLLVTGAPALYVFAGKPATPPPAETVLAPAPRESAPPPEITTASVSAQNAFGRSNDHEPSELASTSAPAPAFAALEDSFKSTAQPVAGDEMNPASSAGARLDELGAKGVTTPQPSVRRAETKQSPSRKAAPQPPAGPHPARGWYIQLAAFLSHPQAEALTKQLQAYGYDSRVYDFSSAGRPLFRVLAGPAANQAAASQLRVKLEQLSFIDDAFIRYMDGNGNSANRDTPPARVRVRE